MQKKGALEEAMEIVIKFANGQEERIKERQKCRDRVRTAKATKARSIYSDKNRELLTDLEEFLGKVEDIWHPRSEKSESNSIRKSSNSKKYAISHVFKEHEQEIETVLKKHSFHKDFQNRFSKAFDDYTQIYLDNFGMTKNGHQQEKITKQRSEASKKKSSEAAKRMWKNRRK